MKPSVPFDQLLNFLMELDLVPAEGDSLTTDEAAELLIYGNVVE